MSRLLFVVAGLVLIVAAIFGLQALVIVMAIIGLLYSCTLLLIFKSRHDIQIIRDNEPIWFSLLWFVGPSVGCLIITLLPLFWAALAGAIALGIVGVFQWAELQPLRRHETTLRARNERFMHEHKVTPKLSV